MVKSLLLSLLVKGFSVNVMVVTVSSAMSSPTLDERVRGFSLEVPATGSHVGDSGYMSQDPLVRPVNNPAHPPQLAGEFNKCYKKVNLTF